MTSAKSKKEKEPAEESKQSEKRKEKEKEKDGKNFKNNGKTSKNEISDKKPKIEEPAIQIVGTLDRPIYIPDDNGKVWLLELCFWGFSFFFSGRKSSSL